MCGIAGLVGNARREDVRHMMKYLRHRGPDDEGLHRAGKNILGHTRLSIMDLEGGHQPISNESGEITIVANGEIYNYPKLRERLDIKHKFLTSSDTEAILHLFEDTAHGAVTQLDGMYAFAIADENGCFLARDPIGIKPLYYARKKTAESEMLWFASEMKALAGTQSHIEEFPPGTYYHTGSGFEPYFELEKLLPVEEPVEKAAGKIRNVLEKAIEKRLMSDAPLGVFLSGGLDSSIIAAVTKKHVRQLHSFSVGIEGSRDLRAARKVAGHIGSIHHEYEIKPHEVFDKLQDIIYHLESYDQDLVRSAIPCYFCSRLASDYVKVILTGEGADELFAGYTYYKDITDFPSLHGELLRSVSILHNINLQRVDRMTMAHGIEGRVPFLDLDLINLAQQIEPELKLRMNENGQRIEKWILRKAFEDLLPESIVWRRKEQFDEGSGTVDMMGAIIGNFTDLNELRNHIEQHSECRIRSLEEACYHKLFLDSYSRPEAILKNVARWRERPF